MPQQLDDDDGEAAGGSPPLESSVGTLAAIPVIETGRDFPLTTLSHFKGRIHDLFDLATRRYPTRALRALDKVSRAWLVRNGSTHLAEIDAVAQALGRPGTYFFSVNYEWGCTCRAAPGPEGSSPRLIRVLDWMTPGLGRNLVCARVSGAPAGPFVVLTWPGYTGVLQMMAPGRFSAALNQAPMRISTGLYYFDWVSGRRRVWGSRETTPAHLLRDVSERARSFEEAKAMLVKTPVSTPGIYTIAGTRPGELAVIERLEHDARLREGAHVAANHWESAGWQGHARGVDSPGRARMMHTVVPRFGEDFGWLKAPVLNDRTRIAAVMDAGQGRLEARGYEGGKPATELLDLTWRIAN